MTTAPLSSSDENAVRQLAALAHPTRLQVFRALMRAGPGGLPAGALSDTLNVGPSSLSAHLTGLREAGLVEQRRDGRKRIYSAELAAAAGLVDYLVSDCCNGHPQVCAPLNARRTAC
ncbi:MAG: metalloregulator ArsR/SmtB family transcription factor [Pseudomonadota bacterium]